MKFSNTFFAFFTVIALMTSCSKNETLNTTNMNDLQAMQMNSNTITKMASKSKPCEATITVSFIGDCVTVTSSKDLSNVVIQTASGDLKFDNLNQGTSGTFCSPSGETITTVWVKSGCNASGDGPGYGERFDNNDDDRTGGNGGGDADD